MCEFLEFVIHFSKFSITKLQRNAKVCKSFNDLI